MWPDQPYASARGSFERPVLPPTVDPTASPTKTITVSCAWLPYIRGALQQLALQATWNVPGPTELTQAQMRAMTLISLFDECSGALPIACANNFNGVDGHGWLNQPNTPVLGATMGTFVPFVGWEPSTQFDGAQTFSAVYIYKDFSPAISLTSYFINYGLTLGPGTVPAQHGIYAFNGGSLVQYTQQDWRSFSQGMSQVYGAAFAPVTVTRIYVQMVCNQQSGNVGPAGALTINDFAWGMDGGDCS